MKKVTTLVTKAVIAVTPTTEAVTTLVATPIQKICCRMGFTMTGEVHAIVQVQGVIRIISTQPTSPFRVAPSLFSINCTGLTEQNLLFLLNSTGIGQARGIEVQAVINTTQG